MFFYMPSLQQDTSEFCDFLHLDDWPGSILIRTECVSVCLSVCVRVISVQLNQENG